MDCHYVYFKLCTGRRKAAGHYTLPTDILPLLHLVWHKIWRYRICFEDLIEVLLKLPPGDHYEFSIQYFCIVDLSMAEWFQFPCYMTNFRHEILQTNGRSQTECWITQILLWMWCAGILERDFSLLHLLVIFKFVSDYLCVLLYLSLIPYISVIAGSCPFLWHCPAVYCKLFDLREVFSDLISCSCKLVPLTKLTS